MSANAMHQLFDGDVTPEQLWQLFDWCLAHGATAFTVGFLSEDGQSSLGHADDPSPFRDAIEERLRPFAVQQGEPNRWRLTPETIACIRAMFPAGLLASIEQSDGWAVDLRLSRGQDGMFWAVAHEGYVFVNVTGQEAAELRANGFKLRPVRM